MGTIPLPTRPAALLLGALASVAPAATTRPSADFPLEVRRALSTLSSVLPTCNRLIEAGDLPGALARLAAVFPEAQRSAAQSLALGNVLFDLDAKQSYALHRAAYQAEPASPLTLWEWAIEQHRAGDFANAQAAYEAYARLTPRRAACFAMQADCLLRLNRLTDAARAWQRAEQLTPESPNEIEQLICSVHRAPAPFARRDRLLKDAVEKKDPALAGDLIALDCDFPQDACTSGPNRNYALRDLPKLAAALPWKENDPQYRALLAGAGIAQSGGNPRAMRGILQRQQLLIDPDQTVPEHPALLRVIVAAALRANVIDATQRAGIASKVLDLALRTHDPAAWFAELQIVPTRNPDVILGLLHQAWKESHDAVFAGAFLAAKANAGQLNRDDPDLQAALKEFPEDGRVQRVRYELAKRQGKLTPDLLAAAARAEFHRLTRADPFALAQPSPGLANLQDYFHDLLRLTRDAK